jgi:hypothetical protein
MDTLKETVVTTPPFTWREWEAQRRNPGTGSRRPSLSSAAVLHQSLSLKTISLVIKLLSSTGENIVDLDNAGGLSYRRSNSGDGHKFCRIHKSL